MWVAINQDSEQIDTKQIAHAAIFAHLEIERRQLFDAIPIDPRVRDWIERTEFHKPIAFFAPLSFRPETHRDPPDEVLIDLVNQHLQRPINDGWRSVGYVLAAAASLIRNNNPWHTLDDRGWFVLCKTHTALMARHVQQEIFSSVNPFFSVDNVILDRLITLYTNQPSPVIIPTYYRRLLPALRRYFRGTKEIIMEGEQPSQITTTTGPGRRIVIDAPSEASIDNDPVPPTQVERLIDTVWQIMIITQAHTRTTPNASSSAAAALFSQLLLSRHVYNAVIDNYIVVIRHEMRRPDRAAMLEELLAYIHDNNTWET